MAFAGMGEEGEKETEGVPDKHISDTEVSVSTGKHKHAQVY